jgi:hypothetical protein
MKRTNLLKKTIIISAALPAVIVSGSALVSAASANTVINASINSTIGVSSGGTVNLSITPGSSGSVTSASDTVQVTTSDALGYTLTFADTDANTYLANGTNHINASSGTQSSPANLTTDNTWGYRVDGVGGFGSGPTAVESNVSSSSFTWAGIPSSPNTIRTTNSPASNDPTTFWYAVRANQTIPSGTYTDTVTYTATAN